MNLAGQAELCQRNKPLQKSHYFKTTKVYFWSAEGPVPFCPYSSLWNLLHSDKGVGNITNCSLVVKASIHKWCVISTHILLTKEVTWPHLTSRSREEVHQAMYLGWASQNYWRTLVTTRYSISQLILSSCLLISVFSWICFQ